MAVARHAVNRTGAKSGDSVVVFGAGPIGLGATIGYKLSGARSVVVADVVPSRLEKALAVGADAVINSAEEDVVDQLTKLHGSAATAIGKPRPGTDINLDAAGVPVVIDTALSAAKQGATLGVVALHKKPVSVDFGAILDTEVNIVTSMGYPTEIFQVTKEIAQNWERFVGRGAHLGSDRLAAAGLRGQRRQDDPSHRFHIAGDVAVIVSAADASRWDAAIDALDQLEGRRATSARMVCAHRLSTANKFQGRRRTQQSRRTRSAAPAPHQRSNLRALPRSRGPRCTLYLNMIHFLIGQIALVTVTR